MGKGVFMGGVCLDWWGVSSWARVSSWVGCVLIGGGVLMGVLCLDG